MQGSINGNGYLPISDSRNNLVYNMKNILEWLEWAKEQGYEWADAAIRNYDPNFVPIKEANSLIDAIGNAFSWGNSPEKYEYWEGVCESLRDTTPDGKDFWLDVFESLRDTTPVSPISLEALIED